MGLALGSLMILTNWKVGMKETWSNWKAVMETMKHE